MIESIDIQGYKSIKDLKLKLKPINIFIGANGSGKSNLLLFFELLNKIYDQKLESYVALGSGIEKMLYCGSKVTDEIHAHIYFAENVNEYSFTIQKSADNRFVFTEEKLWYKHRPQDISNYKTEACVKDDDSYWARYIRAYLNSFKKYHFHDTSNNSPFTKTSHIENDIYLLYEKGENLAAFLFNIRKTNTIVYNRIVKVIQSVAPYFSDFFLKSNDEGYIRLLWQDKFSSTTYGVNDLSDGTIRFIALVTLFLQPNLPETIIIDEPELGLHPFAIAKLAGLISSAAAKGCQVIIATQSTDLISHFKPEDIVTIDQKDGESKFNRLDSESLSVWLSEYTIDDLWKRNIIQGGQPK